MTDRLPQRPPQHTRLLIGPSQNPRRPAKLQISRAVADFSTPAFATVHSLARELHRWSAVAGLPRWCRLHLASKPTNLRITVVADAKRTLSSLRSARGLRAEILALATALVGSDAQGQLLVRTPLISPATVQRVWDGAMSALEPSIRGRMNLAIDRSPALRGRPTPTGGPGIIQLDPPNFRYEVLRQLVGASLERGGLQTVRNVAKR